MIGFFKFDLTIAYRWIMTIGQICFALLSPVRSHALHMLTILAYCAGIKKYKVTEVAEASIICCFKLAFLQARPCAAPGQHRLQHRSLGQSPSAIMAVQATHRAKCQLLRSDWHPALTFQDPSLGSSLLSSGHPLQLVITSFGRNGFGRHVPRSLLIQNADVLPSCRSASHETC